MSPGRASPIASAIALRRSSFDAVLHPSLLQPHQRVVDDRERILAARIVGGEHHEIAAPPRRFAHQRTLGAIAIAAAAEHRQRLSPSLRRA